MTKWQQTAILICYLSHYVYVFTWGQTQALCVPGSVVIITTRWQRQMTFVNQLLIWSGFAWFKIYSQILLSHLHNWLFLLSELRNFSSKPWKPQSCNSRCYKKTSLRHYHSNHLHSACPSERCQDPARITKMVSIVFSDLLREWCFLRVTKDLRFKKVLITEEAFQSV